MAAAPDAPRQPFVGRRDGIPRGAVVARSGPLWTYRPAARGSDLPLVVLLDGEQRLRLGIADTFDQLIASEAVPPFAAVLVPSRPGGGRVEDLTCNPRFVSSVADEVVPQARRWTGCGSRTVIAGKSLGGLTALYATMLRPDVFGGALVQSGSFWWPNTGDPATREWLTAQVADHGPGRVYVEVGLQEWVLLDPTRRMAAALAERGAELQYREYDGGHDPACWRGGLADGLIWTL